MGKTGAGVGAAVWTGAGATALYVAAVVTVPLTSLRAIIGLDELKTFNEWGDYFAGFVSPIALAWFVAALFVQRKEFVLQRQELEEARRVWTEQKDEQQRLAAATEEANKLAAQSLFMSMYSVSREVIENQSSVVLASITRHCENDGCAASDTMHALCVGVVEAKTNPVRALSGALTLFSTLKDEQEAFMALRSKLMRHSPSRSLIKVIDVLVDHANRSDMVDMIDPDYIVIRRILKAV